MSKKLISFGKINFNLKKPSETQNNEAETAEENSTSGFGTFGRTPIQDHKEIEEIAEDLENQHMQQVMGIKNFGKKAKSFSIEEMVEQAKKTAQQTKRKSEAEKAEEKAKEAAKDLSSEDEDLIGPLPPGMAQKQEENDKVDNDELVGPPIPKVLMSDKTKDDDVDDEKDEDSYDELSGSDDEDTDLAKRIPNTHEVNL